MKEPVTVGMGSGSVRKIRAIMDSCRASPARSGLSECLSSVCLVAATNPAISAM